MFDSVKVPIQFSDVMNQKYLNVHFYFRGIAIEGFCSFIAGLLGCGHATTTYGGNIGAIGVTKVPLCIFIFRQPLHRMV